MQYRQLRYFVGIVDAGSFSRAATTLHVAQPALSQQIADLEARLGAALLLRSARGVQPTAAGQLFYQEASALLKRIEALPSLLRSHADSAEGVVALGIASTLAPSMAGRFIEACTKAFPKVSIRFTDGTSERLISQVESRDLELALVFEDEFVATLSRIPLFRQRLFLVSREPTSTRSSISMAEVAELPLILPTRDTVRRQVIDRAFEARGVLPKRIVVETDTVPSEISALNAGVGCAILLTGNMSSFPQATFSEPLPIEPALFMTGSLISSSDHPLASAGEAVRTLLRGFVKEHFDRTKRRGIEWIS